MGNKKKLAPIKRPSFEGKSSIPTPQIGRSEKLLFSFSLLDFSNEYYNCSGLCDKGIKNCFEKLSEYSNKTINELFSNPNGTIRFHTIKKSDVSDWPEYLQNNDQLEDSFKQIAFGASQGRAHGILIDNVFYIIWLDPHHYLYHNKRYGPKKKYSSLENCCSHREAIIDSQAETIEALQEEIQFLKECLDEKNVTNP